MAQTTVKRSVVGKETQFYLLFVLILFFALIKVIFNKYVHNLFAVFFRVSLKQKQMREQLLQTPLASLLLNILFILTGGIYVAYLANYYNVFQGTGFGWLLLYGAAGLAAIYLVKLIVLKITGWVFNIKDATETYTFIVFLVNKLIGITLIPFLLFMAFSQREVVKVAVTLSYVIILFFFLYRYIISYRAIRKEIKVSQFHFFLYLCALEIIPLLLIYKVLLAFVDR